MRPINIRATFGSEYRVRERREREEERDQGQGHGERTGDRGREEREKGRPDCCAENERGQQRFEQPVGHAAFAWSTGPR